MVIQTSNVMMASQSVKTSYNYESVSCSGWGSTSADFISAIPTATDGAQTDATEQSKQTDTNDLYEAMTQNSFVSNLLSSRATDKSEEFLYSLSDERKVEFQSLENMLNMMSTRMKLRHLSPRELFERLFMQMKENARERFNYAPAAKTSQTYEGVNLELTRFEKEVEKTEFTSSGCVKTADGRELDFNVSFMASSSFTRESTMNFDFKRIYMMDPLVVNLSSDIAEVSDQTFSFDLDLDGEEDNISYLCKNSAFLALDRNEDGIINDGSELFGAKSGDGFKELAVFDLDGNGWIDENDEIFNHLKIWKKHDDGTDELVGLGVAGVGAIYLGNVGNDMTFRNEMGEVTGALRQTGIYLNENGTAGTIQHIDLSKRAVEG